MNELLNITPDNVLESIERDENVWTLLNSISFDDLNVSFVPIWNQGAFTNDSTITNPSVHVAQFKDYISCILLLLVETCMKKLLLS